jgi:histidinol-phosphate/aromatic aminotransferase/cobyric acid decarboxylase-like protein
MVGNGAAELIKALMESTKGAVGCVFPTFEEYPNRLPAARVVAYTPQSPGFRYTAPDLIQFFSGRDISALVLVNPDNPSGNCLSRNSLKAMLDWSSFSNIRLVVDESFLDFSERVDEISLLSDSVLERYPNLVVIKSISKSYGVPGLRLGTLASADEALIAKLKKDVAIWNINSFGEFYMQIEEKYKKDYATALVQIREERKRFAKELDKVPGVRVIPSQANFIMVELEEGISPKELLKKLLVKHEILIKELTTKTNGRNYLRLAVRNTADNDKLIHALKKELA